MVERQRCLSLLCQLVQRGSHHGTSAGPQQAGHFLSSLWHSSSTATPTSNSTGAPLLLRAARQFLSNRSLATQPPPRPTHQTPARVAQPARSAAAQGSGRAAAGAGAASGSTTAELSQFEQWMNRMRQVPNVPKVLGFAGVIPFIALAPPVCKHLAPLLPTTISENCAMIQTCYGALIVTFLGAVHWGVAMASPLTSPIAARLATEAYIYSVIPSLAAWPVTLMEPGPGAIVLVVLLSGCFFADYQRRNLGLPAWYMTLRKPLTFLAIFGLLLTATRHIHAEMDKVKEAEQQAQLAEADSKA